jgi:uncharacterized protein YndB with AHSA1/START domain
MHPSDKTAPGQTDAIAFAIDLQHTPARVWRALTDPALLAEWLLPAIGFELEVGAAFRYQTEPHPGWDGTVTCRILEIEEHRRISYTWTVPLLDTVVTFTLTPIAAGTHLSIVQSGFKPDQRREWGGARYGWGLMGSRLVELLGRTS